MIFIDKEHEQKKKYNERSITNMTYSIVILDATGKKIGELPTATPAQVLNLLGKGFTCIDITNNMPLTEQEVSSIVGVIDGLIN